MPLKLVLGPANAAKAGEVLSAFQEASARGALLVVPTAADADHYARELSAGSGAVLGSVLTFAGLAGEIAARSGYSDVRLSKLQRERVLRRVVGRLELPSIERSAASHGFAAAAGELIAELARSLITAERFSRALRAWASADPRRGPYARDLAALYSAYAQELRRLGRVDGELHAREALDALRAAPARWGRDAVFFYGFDELTALERDGVETLARIVDAEVTVSLAYEPGRAAFAARAEAVEELRPLADQVLELPALDEYYESRSRTALHHLERCLFEPGRTRLDPADAVRLLEAGGERAEAELIAAEIRVLLAGGVAAEEIVVVCRSLAQRAPLLERVFAQYGLPAHAERRLPFIHTALGRALLALARCAWDPDAAAGELLAYLRAPGRLRTPAAADHLEFELRRGALSSAADALALLGWEVEEVAQLREAAEPARVLARQARRLLARPHRGEAAVLAGDEELDARALAALLRALAELEELGEHLSGPELIELLGEVEVVSGGGEGRGGVLVAEPLGIRARRFRVVFVCGLQEGEFPRLGAPEPFLSDERRRELAAASGLRLQLSEDSLARERYLFYASVSRATEQVVLSYRSSDEEGNIEVPSPLLADVGEVLVEDWAQRRRKRLLADVVWDPAAAPTSRELARSEAAAAAPSAGEPEVPVRVLSEQARAYVRHQRILSAGALETFADCPMRWLIERELGPAALEPDPAPVVRGSYMHEVLEELLRRLEGPITSESVDTAERILEEILRELPTSVGAGQPEAVRTGLLRSIEADLRRYLSHEAADACGWSPEDVELKFGFADDADSLPALELGSGEERIAVRGVIDRVDVAPDGSARAIVRDYKSGGVRPEYQGLRWETDRRLQVALYMLAVRRLLEVEPVAGLYQPLGGSDLRARGVFEAGAPVGTRVVPTDARTPEELAEVLDGAERRALELAHRLRSGELVPCPQTCSRDGCRYPGICRAG